MAVERGREHRDIETCINRYSLDPATVNVYSALARAFVECYVELKPDRYVSEFTRVVVERLRSAYSCEKLQGVFQSIAKRLDEVASALTRRMTARGDGFTVYELQLTTWSRLLVGSRGGPLPFEVTLMWDTVLNVPFIPSSSIKGAARAYFESHVGSVGGYTVEDLFGSEGHEGLVKFTDAYPVSCKISLVEPEVLTPHYSEVSGNIDEASSRPVPIVFLVVPPGVTFRLLMIAETRRTGVLDNIARKIAEALSRGVGAKTMLGYGLFTTMIAHKT